MRARLAGTLVAAILVLAACDSAQPGIASPSAAPAASPTAAATASPPAVTPTPRPTPSAPPSVSPGCPEPGAAVTLDELVAIPAECAPLELAIAGWWDIRRERDLPELTSFSHVLREQVPPYDEEEEPDLGQVVPLDIRALETDTALLGGRWTELRVELASDATSGAEDPHCFWSVNESEPVSSSLPPVLTCPTFARVLEATVETPPEGALDACPGRSKVIPVELFVRYPRDCFGERSVRIAGWFDTDFVVSGWEAPWEIKPGWLWSNQIGPVPVLAETSNAMDWEHLVLHYPPSSPLADASQNRWVELTGHYARADEYSTCRYVYEEEWYGGENPVAGTLDDADARADCAMAFVAESVEDTEPR